MNFGEYFQFFLALLFVIGLIVLLALGARRLGFGFPVTAIKRNGQKRLSIIEVTPIDARRRLVLVRCDDREHLLLLGPNTETVVATNFSRKAFRTPKSDTSPKTDESIL